MTVYHRPFVNVGANVYKHRRHANHPGRDVSAVAYARAARNDAYAIFSAQLPNRIGMLVEETKTAIRWRHVYDTAHAKTRQDAALDPGICFPLAIRVAFGGADLSAVERRFEIGEQGEVRLGIFARFARG